MAISALSYQGASSSRVIGQSSMLAPSRSPYTLRIRNSWSMNRGVAPAQCVVVPPTALTIQVGRFGKSRDTRHEPLVVRMSSQAIWLNAGHSSLT